MEREHEHRRIEESKNGGAGCLAVGIAQRGWEGERAKMRLKRRVGRRDGMNMGWWSWR